MDRRQPHAQLDPTRRPRAPGGKGDAERGEPQDHEGGERCARHRGRDHPLGTGGDRERDERSAGKRRADEIPRARPALTLLGEIADERRDRQIVRSPERGDREGERGQKSVGEAEQHDVWIDRRGERDRDDVRQQPIHDKWKRRAERGAAERSGERDGEELDQRQQDNARSRRADRLQDREGCALALDEAPRRVGDADAADDQRQEACERQEFGESVEVAGEVRGDVEPRARLPAGLRECLIGLVDKRFDGRFVGRAARSAHDDPCRPSDERPRLDKSGRLQRGLRDDHARPQANADRQAVGLAGHDGAKDEFRFAKFEDVADSEIQAGEQRLFGRRAEAAVPFGERLGGRHRRVEDGRPDRGPRRLDRLDFDQRRVAALGPGHCPHGRNGRERPVAFEERLFVRRQATMDQRERGVAAEDDAPLAPQAVVEGLRQALDPDDRHDPKRDAEEKDAQPCKAAPEVAQGEAGNRRTAARLRDGERRDHADTSGASSTAPERMRTIRSQRAASAGS